MPTLITTQKSAPQETTKPQIRLHIRTNDKQVNMLISEEEREVLSKYFANENKYNDFIKKINILENAKFSVENKLKEISAQMGRSVEDIKKTVLKGQEDYLNNTILSEKVIKVLNMTACPYCNQNHINIVHDKNGKIYLAETYAEHKANGDIVATVNGD